MNATVVNVALVAVLLILGIYGLVRAMRSRSAGDPYALPLARAIGCIAVAVVLVVVTAAVTP
jgi:putative effector of murein hydrolase